MPGQDATQDPGTAPALPGPARARQLLLRRRGAARDRQLARHPPTRRPHRPRRPARPDEAIDHWKARGVDLSQILAFPELADGAPRAARRAAARGAREHRLGPRRGRRGPRWTAASRWRSRARCAIRTAAWAGSCRRTSRSATSWRAARRHDPRRLRRHRQPVVRRLAAGVTFRCTATPAQLHRRRGLSSRTSSTAYVLGHVPAERTSDRQRHSLGCDERQMVAPRSWPAGRYVRNSGDKPSSRASRRPAAEVHDRRAR